MRTTLTFCLMMLVAYGQAQNVTLRGKIKNPIAKSVKIYYKILGEEYQQKEVLLDSKNEFSWNIPFKKVASMQFTHGEFEEPSTAIFLKNILLEPGDDLMVSFDAKDYWKTLKVEGKGAEKWNYAKEWTQKMDIQLQWQNKVYEKAGRVTTDELFVFLDTVDAEAKKILAKYEKLLSPMSYKIQQADAIGDIKNSMLTPIFMGKAQYPDLTPQQRKKMFEGLPPQNDTTALAPGYVSFLESVYRYETHLLSFNLKTPSNTDLQRASIMKKFLHPTITETICGQNVLSHLSYAGIDEYTQQEYDDFLAEFPNSHFVEKL
ncbi:MAG: hypothetical protein ACK4GN_08850, partial [Runella sp.]